MGPNLGDRPGGYSKALAREVIAEVRTDMDAFTPAEIGVLENHGYLLADAAIHRWLPALIRIEVPPLRLPHPEWPDGTDEQLIRRALAESGKRKLPFGRWR